MKAFLRFLTITIPIICLVLAGAGRIVPVTAAPEESSTSTCNYWIAPPPAGDDSNPGTQADPWATLQHAAETIPDNGCTVWFESGTYVGENQVEARFQTLATFKAIIPYSAVLENGGPTLSLKGARNLIFEGFEFRHSPQAAGKHVIETARKTGTSTWTENVIFRNNIIHDSYNNDLMKIHNGSRFITVENNVFYNQDIGEQHMDVNSVTDVVIQDNIFFNDFGGSGRQNNSDTKHFIVVKDSNEGEDGLEGSERVTIRRNIFLNWEGELVTFMQFGNDGKAFHEAKDVLVENNLLIGNSANTISAPVGIRGARNVTLRNNTVVGDLPAKAYGVRAEILDLNPQNQNIFLFNNVWSDPTGTMGADGPGDSSHEFSNGDPGQSSNVLLDNNLYWNGGSAIPPGDLVSPLVDDANRIVADPLLNTDHGSITLPRWNGASFLSGNTSIRDEFTRLVAAYGQIPAGSPAVGQADPAKAPGDDILGRPRPAGPDLGAYEYETGPGGTATPTPTNTPLPTTTSTPSPTATNTAPPMATSTPQPAATNTAEPTATNTPAATPTPGITDTGWVGPAANSSGPGGDGDGFEVDPAHGHADDDYLALDANSGSNKQSSCASDKKDSHYFLDYRFDLPAGATISGIEVRLDALVDSSEGSPVMCVQLSWNGGSGWSALQSTPVLTADERSYLLGGAGDAWGHDWTAAELRPANFRVRIVNAAQSTVRDFSLDWLAVKVYYQDDGPGPQATPTPNYTRFPAAYLPLIVSSG